jgi:capsular polysaccharide biosynthesis protein
MIRNIDEITKSLSTMEGVYLTVQDFTQIDMKAQIVLVRSAGILVSVHGAALAHTLYMSIGTRILSSHIIIPFFGIINLTDFSQERIDVAE